MAELRIQAEAEGKAIDGLAEEALHKGLDIVGNRRSINAKSR